MSKFSISIGQNLFSSKTKAIEFYKEILNKYQFGEILSSEDAQQITILAFKDDFVAEDLADYAVGCLTITCEDEIEWVLTSIIVDRHLDFRKVKCFYFIWSSEVNVDKDIFSYRQAINGQPSDAQKFSRACRFCVHQRLREFKIQQFKNRPVRCAITNNIVEWEECQVDHKSPLTFSVIVKSFIISHNVEIQKVEYGYQNSREFFIDPHIAEQFYKFHKQMAVLRILSTQENIKRSGSARITPGKKDGVIVDDC